MAETVECDCPCVPIILQLVRHDKEGSCRGPYGYTDPADTDDDPFRARYQRLTVVRKCVDDFEGDPGTTPCDDRPACYVTSVSEYSHVFDCEDTATLDDSESSSCSWYPDPGRCGSPATCVAGGYQADQSTYDGDSGTPVGSISYAEGCADEEEQEAVEFEPSWQELIEGVDSGLNVIGANAAIGTQQGIWASYRLAFNHKGARIPIKLWQRYKTITKTYGEFGWEDTEVWSSTSTLITTDAVEIALNPPSVGSKSLMKLMFRAAWMPMPADLESDGH